MVMNKVGLVFPVVMSLAGSLAWAATPARTMRLGEDKPRAAVIRVAGDKLVLVFRERGPNSRVAVLDRQGTPVAVVTPGIEEPGTLACTILDAGVADHDVLIVSLVLRDRSGKGTSYLAEYSMKTGARIRLVTTTPVQCYSLAPTEDGAWCLAVSNGATAPYDVVIHYGLTGENLGGLFPSDRFSQPPDAWVGPTEPMMVAGGGRFAAWLPASHALLTWSADGAQARRLDLAPRASEDHRVPDRLAMKADGTIMALLATGSVEGRPELPRRALFSLDSEGRLSRLAGPGGEEPPNGWFLAGVDRDCAVYYEGAKNLVHWVSLK